MTSTRQLQALRRDTAAMIKAEPTILVLHRYGEPQPDSAGGTLPGAPLDVAQHDYYFGGLAAGAGYTKLLASEQGEEVLQRYVLIGTHDADIREGDWFFINGLRYEVADIDPDRSFQVKANVKLVTGGE